MGRRNKFTALLLPLLAGLAVAGLRGVHHSQSVKADGTPWAFDSKQDVMIDDFYHDDVHRDVTPGADSGFSYIKVRTNHPAASGDDALYKYASALEKKDANISFSLFIDTEVDLDKLTFNVRGGGTGTVDEWSTAPLKITATFDGDGAPNDAIAKNAWTTLTISVPNSFSGVTYAGGGTVSDSALGFTFYGDSTNSGFVKIREVKVNNTIIDNFSREATDQPAGAYWSGFDGELVRRFVTLSPTHEYKYKLDAPIEFDNIVLSLAGDLISLEVALVGADGTLGAYVGHANLKDRFNAALIQQTPEYVNVDINIGHSGLQGAFYGISLKADAEIKINTFFVTNAVSRLPEVVYPGLDVSEASFINDFNFVGSGPFTEGYADAPQVFKDHGINFVAPWHNAQGVSVDGESLVLPTVPDGDYGGFFFGVNDPIIRDYIVIQARALDGANFSNLRFNFYGTQTSALWLKDAKAGFGLPTLAADYPYVDDDGFAWLLVAVDENELLDRSKLNGEVTVYWGHSVGTIEISAIFYADAKEVEYETSVINDEEVAVDGYQYVGYVEPGVRYLTLSYVAGEGGANLTVMALEQEGIPSKYLKDGELIGADGNPLSVVNLVADEVVTLKIDLELSGYDTSHGANFHSHWYAMGDVVLGSLKRTNVAISKIDAVVTSLISAPMALNVVAAGAGYAYGGGLEIPAFKQQGDILRLTFSSAVAVADGLKDVRIEFPGGVRWFVENPEGTLRDRHGKLLSVDLAKGETAFEISLTKSGLNPMAFVQGKGIHFHFTNNTATPLELTIETFAIVREQAPVVTEGLVFPDYVKPEVTIAAAAAEYHAGDTVVINVTATDNISAVEDLTIAMTVTIGSGPTLQDVAVVGTSFVAETAGVYTVTVTVTDEAGNATVKALEVTVLAAPVDPGTSEPPVSEPPTSEPPVSEPPASETPASETPTSVPPASEPTPPRTGCFGNIGATLSISVALLGLAAVLVIKRKRLG